MDNNNGFHPSVNDLLQDITQPTEQRKPQSEVVILPAEENESEQQQSSGKKQHEEAQQPITEEALEASADLTLALLDFTQTNTFRFIANRKKSKKGKTIAGESWKENLEDLLNEIEAKQINRVTQLPERQFSPKEAGLLRLHKAAEEFFDSLPLEDHEKEALKTPLIAVMRAHGGNIPPGLSLTLTAMQIFGGRAANLFML